MFYDLLTVITPIVTTAGSMYIKDRRETHEQYKTMAGHGPPTHLTIGELKKIIKRREYCRSSEYTPDF